MINQRIRNYWKHRIKWVQSLHQHVQDETRRKRKKSRIVFYNKQNNHGDDEYHINHNMNQDATQQPVLIQQPAITYW